MAQKKVHNEENTYQEISNYFIKWLGIVVCVLSLIGLFINSESILNLIFEMERDHRLNDSNAGEILYSIELFMLNLLIWLKKLPIVAKVIGAIIGGLLWFTHNEE
jgi:hypothetical protein